MHTFYEKKLLTEEDIQDCWKLYHELPERWCYQDHSLFNVDKRNLRSVHNKLPFLKKLNSYIESRYGLVHDSSYFLKYVKWSFTRVHVDNIGLPTKTIITFLEQSEDLEGGETIVYDKHFDLPVPPGHQVNRTGSIHRANEVPCTPKITDGNCLVYDSTTKHGVSMLTKGHRIVLVSWYKTPQKTE